jgi:hypothetical protein
MTGPDQNQTVWSDHSLSQPDIVPSTTQNRCSQEKKKNLEVSLAFSERKIGGLRMKKNENEKVPL